MANFYDQYLINVSIIREETGAARAFRYGPSGKDTQIANTVTMYGLPVIMRDSVDIPIPIREREEYHGIGSGKYPSKIVNKSSEPVTFTIEGPMQTGTFLAYAVGECFSTAGSAAGTEKIYIDCLALADITAAAYFQIYDGTDAHYVWMDTTNGDADPTGLGTGLECAIDGATTAADVAAIVAAAVNGDASFGATNTAGSERVVVTCAAAGVTTDPYDVSTDFRIFIQESGCASSATVYAHRITELVTSELESFSMHVEMRNTTSAENIIYDLFGCVVNSLEIEADKATGAVICRAEIMAASWIAGTAANTKIGELDIEPYTWNDLIETGTTGYRFLDEQAAERAPAAIERVLLRISNNVEMKSTIGDQYALYAVAGKREVDLEITGFIQDKTLYDYWKAAYDNVNEYMGGSGSHMSARLKLQRTASTDFMDIFIHNMYLPSDGHNLQIQSIDDSIKAVELKLRCGQPDQDKRQIYAVIVDAQAKTIYHNEAE